MSEYKEVQLSAFCGELRKTAWSLPKNLGAIGAGMGVGVGLGGAVGAAAGGSHDYQEAKRQGATTGQALGSSIGGVLRGGAKGAVIGGAAGGAAGALGHALNPVVAENVRKNLTNRSAFARFGQRQVHGLTGYTPDGGLSSLHMGPEQRMPAVTAAKAELEAARTGKDVRTLSDKLLRRSSVEGADIRANRAQSSYDAHKNIHERGMTSLPGVARALRKDPLGATRAAARDQLAGTSLPMKALTVGAPAAQLGAAAMQNPNDLNAQGQTKGQALGESATSLASGLLLGPLPLATQIAAGVPAAWAGSKAGRLLDRRGVQTAEQRAAMPSVGGV